MQSLPLVAPVSRKPLTREEGGYRAPDGTFFPLRNGIPHFLDDAASREFSEERTGIENALKTFFRRFPRFYRFLVTVISPECFIGFSAKRFLRSFGPEQITVNVGSGIHRYTKSIVNVDAFPYREVDIVADAGATPFATGSVDGVVCEYLLEHVSDPPRIVSEILRILKPGGLAYIVVPFVYPFHACPNDFYRWSREGLRTLCAGAEIVRMEPHSGPASGFLAQGISLLSTLLSFGNQALYDILSAVFTVFVFPFKFLDLLLQFLPTSANGAAAFCVVIRKTHTTRA